MKLKRTLRKLIENEKLNERNYRNCIVLSAYCGSDYYKRLGRHFCSNCGKEYRWMQSLIRHEKEECGKDPQHSCPVCGTKIRHKWMLKKHLINVHHWVIPNGKNFYLGSTDNSAQCYNSGEELLRREENIVSCFVFFACSIFRSRTSNLFSNLSDDRKIMIGSYGGGIDNQRFVN